MSETKSMTDNDEVMRDIDRMITTPLPKPTRTQIREGVDALFAAAHRCGFADNYAYDKDDGVCTTAQRCRSDLITMIYALTDDRLAAAPAEPDANAVVSMLMASFEYAMNRANDETPSSMAECAFRALNAAGYITNPAEPDAGTVLVSREDIRRILNPIKHRANEFAGIGQTDEMQALDAIHKRFRAALGEKE